MKLKVSFCILVMLGMLAGTVCAETYTWVDSSGTVNFTEDISQVPKRYLKKLRVRGDMSTSAPVAIESAADSVPASPVEAKPSVVGGEEKEVLYGNRSGKSWKADFDVLRAEISSTDGQVNELNSRLNDPSKISRADYIGIQSSVRNYQFHRNELEKKLKLLDAQASQAGVPGEFR